MAALMSGRWPSSSRQTMPISSVTLACLTLVTTGNFCANSQITGLVISFGGYISHKRDFCEPAAPEASAGRVPFFAVVSRVHCAALFTTDVGAPTFLGAGMILILPQSRG